MDHLAASLLAVSALVMAACSAASTTSTTSSSPATAKGATSASTTTVPFAAATCSAQGTTAVQCELPTVAGRPYFDLSTLLTEAQAAAPSLSLSDTTPMVITGFGGAGHKGDTYGAGGPGSQGNGGEAQMTTTIATYTASNLTPVLWYYLGLQGPSSYKNELSGGVGGLGGASTIVSPYNLTIEASSLTLACIDGVSGTQYNESGCSSTNLVLDAGGGGGGGEGAVCNGGGGGSGGTAISTTSGPASAPGGGGGDGACTDPGKGGGGGNQGNSGGGGGGGGGINSHGGGQGNDGAGGLGGSVHTPNGASQSVPWTNVGYCLNEIGNSGSGSYTCPTAQSSPAEWGAGGEGEWRGSAQPVGGGGGGGGGWGGGGGGGGGGDSVAGGGGGAGGTFAAKSTTTASSFTEPANPDGSGEVFVTFVA